MTRGKIYPQDKFLEKVKPILPATSVEVSKFFSKLAKKSVQRKLSHLYRLGKVERFRVRIGNRGGREYGISELFNGLFDGSSYLYYLDTPEGIEETAELIFEHLCEEKTHGIKAALTAQLKGFPKKVREGVQAKRE